MHPSMQPADGHPGATTMVTTDVDVAMTFLSLMARLGWGAPAGGVVVIPATLYPPGQLPLDWRDMRSCSR